MKQHPNPLRAGFTLVELSIVLVILGLLVGGVLAGQSLIRAAELRAVSTEYNNYKIALNTFRDKYFAIPGDMPNAIRYWGKQAGGDADGISNDCRDLTHTTPSTDSRTCNGDGDGQIGIANSATNAFEKFRIWQHLANAGLVEGNYTGVRDGDASGHATIGKNIPRSKLGGAGWSMFAISTANANTFAASAGNSLFYGAAITNNAAIGPILKPEDSYSIDMKLDDGKPNTGIVTTRSNGYTHAPNCVPASNDRYALDNATVACTLIFSTGY